MSFADRRATDRQEQSILSECDGAESFCSMLTTWLEDHKHWMSNGHARDLMNQVSDLISDQRAEIEKDRCSAAQDAADTIGDAKRSAAA